MLLGAPSADAQESDQPYVVELLEPFKDEAPAEFARLLVAVDVRELAERDLQEEVPDPLWTAYETASFLLLLCADALRLAAPMDYAAFALSHSPGGDVRFATAARQQLEKVAPRQYAAWHAVVGIQTAASEAPELAASRRWKALRAAQALQMRAVSAFVAATPGATVPLCGFSMN